MNNNILKNIFRASLAAMIIADLANVVAAIIDGMLTGRFLGAESMQLSEYRNRSFPLPAF